MCDHVLADVAAMANTLPDAILTDRATEIVAFGEGGSGIAGSIEQLGSSSDDEDDEENDV